MPDPELVFFFLAIAFVYASVGFGGGSSYLALLALYGIPFQEMRLTALICNIIVVTGGTYIFYLKRELSFRKTAPLVLTSVPMAFIGAGLHISQHTFFVVLGCCLILAGILLWLPINRTTESNEGEVHYTREVVLGAGIGFLSGMVGIGGGIFLAPILNLMKWDSPKRIAATASFFILINSVAGIMGQMSSAPAILSYSHIAMLAAAVFLGGQLGSRIGVARFSQLAVRRVTGILVLAAGIEVLYKHM